MLTSKPLIIIIIIHLLFQNGPVFCEGTAGSSIPEVSGKIEDLLKPMIEVASAKQSLQFPHVSKEQVKADLQKNPASRQHPRIMMNAQDVASFRKLMANHDPFFQAGLDQLKREAEVYLLEDLPSYQLDAAKLRLTAPHNTQIAISTMAFLYQLTDDARYAKKVKEHLLNMSRFADWNHKKHFLDTGIMAYVVALGYDWISHSLSPTERSEIEGAMIEKGLKVYLKMTMGKPFWYLSPNNWNPICNGGMGLAALAVWDLNSETMDLLLDTMERNFTALPHYIREFEPDGQSVEGLMYWGYGLTALIRWSESMKRTLGSDYAYTETPGLQRAGYFPLTLSGPVWAVSIGDDPISAPNRSGTFLWFAKRYQNAFLARYQLAEMEAAQNYRLSDLMYYDPQLLAQTPESFHQALDFYVHDIEYVSFRSSWDHQNALYVGMHGGDNNASHGHLDAGSFFIQGRGKVWALGGLGRDDYTFPGYFAKTQPDYYDLPQEPVGPGRFHFYRMRAEGKNVLVFNPDSRPDQNPYGKSQFKKIVSTPDTALAVLNLGPVYDRDARRVERGISLFNERKAILIQDEIESKVPAELYWSMHTFARIKLEQEDHIAILELDQERLKVAIKSPENARFVIMPAEYLPGLSFPLTQNSPNQLFGQNVQKLVVHLSGVNRETIAVVFAPIDASVDAGWALKPLQNW